MKENEALYPLYIGVLRADAVVPRPEHRAHAIQEFRPFHRRRRGSLGAGALSNVLHRVAREANLAMALRPNDALVAYNIACMYCNLGQKEDGMKTLRKAWEAGFHDSDWARNDPDLALLHADPEFEKLYPLSK